MPKHSTDALRSDEIAGRWHQRQAELTSGDPSDTWTQRDVFLIVEAASQDIDRLRETLVNVANRTDGDGELCWCHDGWRNGLYVNEHAQWCLNAREALRANT